MDYITGKKESQVIRVLLADDDPMVRRGLRMRLDLEQDIELVGEAGSGPEALCMAQGLIPDVVIMSVELSRMDGIEATRQLRLLVPRAVVIMLSFQDDPATRAQAHKAGAAAFVEKRGSIEPLLEILRRLVSRADPTDRT
jgi:NarL family two-component system response regulator YdfI